MRAERPKDMLLELIHSHHYAKLRKGSTAVYFAGISTRNSFPNK